MLMTFTKYKSGDKVRHKKTGYTYRVAHVIVSGYLLKVQVDSGDIFDADDLEHLG